MSYHAGASDWEMQYALRLQALGADEHAGFFPESQ